MQSPFETQACQLLDTEGGHRRRFSFHVQPVCRVMTQYSRSFLCRCGNIAVPVDFAIVGKLAQTVFPDSVACVHSKPGFPTPGYEVIGRRLSFQVQPVVSFGFATHLYEALVFSLTFMVFR
jgi:hypothetical protein